MWTYHLYLWVNFRRSFMAFKLDSFAIRVLIPLTSSSAVMPIDCSCAYSFTRCSSSSSCEIGKIRIKFDC